MEGERGRELGVIEWCTDATNQFRRKLFGPAVTAATAELREASAVCRVQILKDAARRVNGDPGIRAEFECFAPADRHSKENFPYRR